ncbi:translation initiation factor 2 [Roseburia hominis]
MRGIHHIIVQNESLKYEFDIKRNITVLKGDSATGKTTLVEMIQEYLINGMDSGVNLSCDVACRVLTGNLWKEQLAEADQTIVFIDEGNRFVKSLEFAEAIKKTSNYYVIVTRENLEMLPISVDEIYGIRSSGKYGGLTPVYHQFYRIYDFDKQEVYPLRPNDMIIEDSNSGYEFFSAVSENVTCISAKGKSNIFQILCERKVNQPTLIVADGAAFGSQMNRIERFVKRNQFLHLYLPESFEWLLLKSGILRNSEIKKILDNTAEYVESEKYFSWEQYFTELLVQVSGESYLRYNKKKLNPNYLQPAIMKQIIDSIEGIEFTV